MQSNKSVISLTFNLTEGSGKLKIFIMDHGPADADLTHFNCATAKASLTEQRKKSVLTLYWWALFMVLHTDILTIYIWSIIDCVMYEPCCLPMTRTNETKQMQTYKNTKINCEWAAGNKSYSVLKGVWFTVTISTYFILSVSSKQVEHF